MRARAINQRDNFYYLFVALLLLIVIGPVLTELLGNLGVLIAEIWLSVALVIALWSLRSSRIAFYGGVALILVNILANTAWLLLGSELGSGVSKASGLVFLVLSISRAAYQVFRPDRVDLNKIVGALCIYILIGAIFALSYQLLEDFTSGSFTGLEGHEGHALSWRLIYFSFVTLTTLGYGDVLPLTLYAETLVTLEAVLGQFYLAVLVAGLISAYLSDRENRPV
jgi:hypothetical protein